MSHHQASRVARLPVLIATALLGVAAAAAHAETGSANASDVSVHVSLLGIANLDIDPQIPVGFNASVDAALEHQTLPLLDVGSDLLHLSTGTLLTEAQYQPGATLSFVQSDVNVENLNLSAVSLLGAPLISVSADVIHASSEIAGWCMGGDKNASKTRAPTDVSDMLFYSPFDAGNLFPGGSGGDPGDVVLGGIDISILGIAIPDLPLNPPPNTRVDLSALGIVGASLVLNEQTIGGDGTTMSSVSSTAIHLTLNVAGLITADVQIAHADSMLDCRS